MFTGEEGKKAFKFLQEFFREYQKAAKDSGLTLPQFLEDGITAVKTAYTEVSKKMHLKKKSAQELKQKEEQKFQELQALKEKQKLQKQQSDKNETQSLSQQLKQSNQFKAIQEY